jgi:hypothetical protein|nr:MAG: hypothetical protein [Bacteriophage sp.]
MIRKMFRVIGGFVAFLSYHFMMLPVYSLLFPLMAYIAVKYKTVDLEDLMEVNEIKFVQNLEWPFEYVLIVEKITGWKG